jgi:hypothetical protein
MLLNDCSFWLRLCFVCLCKDLFCPLLSLLQKHLQCISMLVASYRLSTRILMFLSPSFVLNRDISAEWHCTDMQFSHCSSSTWQVCSCGYLIWSAWCYLSVIGLDACSSWCLCSRGSHPIPGLPSTNSRYVHIWTMHLLILSLQILSTDNFNLMRVLVVSRLKILTITELPYLTTCAIYLASYHKHMVKTHLGKLALHLKLLGSFYISVFFHGWCLM